jgi:hypothetical protein
MARFQVLAVNDKATFCECCGKNGLARVVWILDTETGEEKHFGTSCAARPAKGFDCGAEIKVAVASHNAALKAAYGRAARAYRAAGGTYEQGRDAQGSPIATPANGSLWSDLCAAEIAKI